jgi:thioredoxin-dependent peroxiredoxin
MAVSLQVGDRAPAFSAPRHDGGSVSLSDYKGRNLVIYFFPKSDTSGCTKESQAFSALRPAFEEVNTSILGVSADPPKMQAAFDKKYGLGLAFAADEAHGILEPFGVWVQKSMYGRTYWGVERATFLIDRKGKIAGVWRKVKVPGHAEQVLAAARRLNEGPA